MILFAAEEGYFWTVVIPAIVGVVGIMFAKIESIYKVVNDIALTWFKTKSDRDDTVFALLQKHLDGCHKELDILKVMQTKLFDDNNTLLLDNEAQYWWMKSSHDVSLRNACKMREAGLAAEDPPDLPIRKSRKLSAVDGFKERSEQSNESLLHAVGDVVKRKLEDGGKAEGT